MASTDREEAIKMLVAAQAHLGTKNVDSQMKDYVWRRRSDGINILDVSKTWEKLQLAARIIVTIENPADVIAISARPYAQRAVLKYATYTGAQHSAGRYTPGTFTNQITKQVRARSLRALASVEERRGRDDDGRVVCASRSPPPRPSPCCSSRSRASSSWATHVSTTSPSARRRTWASP
jgi:ribosomal protein S2